MGKNLDQNPCFPAPETSYGIHGLLNSALATCYKVSRKTNGYSSGKKAYAMVQREKSVFYILT